MTPQDVYGCFESVLTLPLPKQAACVRLAAEASLPVWRAWCRQRGVNDLSVELLECFDRWLAGTAHDEELSETANRLGESLPQDIRKEREPAGAYAGYALVDIALIALRQGGEVHHSILHTAICFAASASCGIGVEAVWVDLNRLTQPELEFLDQWWKRCQSQFPELASRA